MKYIIRAIKYFIYISIIVIATMTVLALLGFVSKDINVMFRDGWRSVGMIAAMFAFVSAFYPRFGYLTRMVHVGKNLSELQTEISAYMEGRGYRLEGAVLDGPDGASGRRSEKLSYVKRSVLMRILRLGEDRITLSSCIGGFEVEGPAREVQPIVSGLDYRLSDPDGDRANY